MPSLDRSLVLIGFMGAGKSAVSRACASVFGVEALDIDSLLEKKIKMSISDFFKAHSEEAFRDLETAVCRSLLGHTPCVIATGGGIVLRDENKALLSALGTVVFLDVSAETVFQRLQHDKSRPLLRVDDRMGTIKKMLSLRKPLYQQSADIIVDVNQRSVKEIVKEIKEKVV